MTILDFELFDSLHLVPDYMEEVLYITVGLCDDDTNLYLNCSTEPCHTGVLCSVYMVIAVLLAEQLYEKSFIWYLLRSISSSIGYEELLMQYAFRN